MDSLLFIIFSISISIIYALGLYRAALVLKFGKSILVDTDRDGKKIIIPDNYTVNGNLVIFTLCLFAASFILIDIIKWFFLVPLAVALILAKYTERKQVKGIVIIIWVSFYRIIWNEKNYLIRKIDIYMFRLALVMLIFSWLMMYII